MISELEIKEALFDEELKNEIHQGFKLHALAEIGHEWRLDTVAFVAKDEGNLAGACVMHVFWGAVHIKYLYVAEKYRKKHLGTNLITHAIQYGLDHNCSFALVETMSYQALGFYQKLGFNLEFTQSGFSYGTSLHYLRKEISS